MVTYADFGPLLRSKMALVGNVEVVEVSANSDKLGIAWISRVVAGCTRPDEVVIMPTTSASRLATCQLSR